MRRTTILALVLGLGTFTLGAAAPEVHVPGPPAPLQAECRALAGRALASDEAWRDLTSLCDDVGNRLSGSESCERAVAWGLRALREAGLQNVRTEKVMVPHWVRNTESARLVLPTPQDLSILGLGMSVPTPQGGLTADVVVVASLEELDALPDEKVQGRIVLYEAPFAGYGPGSKMRTRGPSEAARKGAVAVLVRSVASLSFDTPHTGTLRYDPAVKPIPAAAVSVENAMMMRRLWDRGQRLRVHLEMDCRTLPDVASANVVGELPGAGRPDEVVLVGGHLDSWDVGQGAQDDGVGVALSIQAARLIREQGLRPDRTIRVVLFANEENGSRGGAAYAEAHAAELPKHLAAIESDTGNGLLKGFVLEPPHPAGKTPAAAQGQAALDRLRPWLGPLLEPLGAGTFGPGHAGEDVEASIVRGVPGLGANHDLTHYWEVHHSKADTLDKVDKGDLARNAAVLAVAVYGLAQMPGTLGAGTASLGL